MPFKGLPDALVQVLRHYPLSESELSRVQRLAKVSTFALEVIAQQPELVAKLEEPLQPLQLMEQQEAEWPVILRRWRRAQSCKLIWRDISGIDTVEQTLQGSTMIAEQALSVAFDSILLSLQRVHGVVRNEDGQEQTMTVLGLGKLGGSELNFSSDVDLVYVFTGHGMSDGDRGLPAETFFTRLGQRLANLLDEVRAEGFSHRVDLRLRPFGASGRLLLSFNAMEHYFQTAGRDWERYAWLKARPVAGDIEAGFRLLNVLKPFVFRRYLDFTAIDGLREMKAKIEKEVQRREIMDDLKLGRGGIREIEFFVQALQIIYGGRTKALQLKGLLPSLQQLHQQALITEQVFAQLQQAYLFLRKVENRVQMMADAQTHQLPEAADQREGFAMALGYQQWTDFFKQLQYHRSIVEQLFSGLLNVSDQQDIATSSLDTEISSSYLQSHGFLQYARHAQRLEALLESSSASTMSDKSRQRLLRVSHHFSQLCAQAAHTDQCLEHALSFLQSIVKRSSYIALLDEQPTALKRMVQVFDKSQWLSQQLINYPLLLDELLDARVMDQRFDAEQLSQQIQAGLSSHTDDIESALLALNEFKISYTFKIAYHFLFQNLPAHKASHLLSLLAEQLLRHCTRLASDELALQHGHIADSSFAVIGYGSLGASCLAFHSDLDLVFLNLTQSQQQSDGKRPLDAARFFLRQAQKLISLLGLSTSSGFLYEVDIRLRPDGAKGLLVSSIDSYEQYQLQRAWVWELQALVRARAVAGDYDLQHRFETLREQLLCVQRDQEVLQKAIITMRLRMRSELDRSDEHLFDLKHGLGGLTDIEFFLQAQILMHSSIHPELTRDRETLAIISCLSKLQLISNVHADVLANAYEHMLNIGLTCHLNNLRRVVAHSKPLAAITASVTDVLQAYDFNFCD